jgi:hypothetical protein
LLSDGEKFIEIVYGDGKKKLFCTEPTGAAKTGNKISCTGTKSPPNQPRKDSYHFYSFIVSVSAVSKGHPSLVSLVLHTAP